MTLFLQQNKIIFTFSEMFHKIINTRSKMKFRIYQAELFISSKSESSRERSRISFSYLWCLFFAETNPADGAMTSYGFYVFPKIYTKFTYTHPSPQSRFSQTYIIIRTKFNICVYAACFGERL